MFKELKIYKDNTCIQAKLFINFDDRVLSTSTLTKNSHVCQSVTMPMNHSE